MQLTNVNAESGKQIVYIPEANLQPSRTSMMELL